MSDLAPIPANDSAPISTVRRAPRWYEAYMLLVGVGGNYVFYGQAIEIFRAESARDVNLTAYVVGLIAVTSWLIYGLFLRSPVLIAANIVAVIGASLCVTGILVYG